MNRRTCLLPGQCLTVTAVSNLDQFFAGGCQNFATLFSDQDHIFDAHAPAPGKVNSGLYRDYHAWLQNLTLPASNARRLVNFQTYAVSGRVCEIST
jgi:hypothetical protein